MWNQSEIEDSLEFCGRIKTYLVTEEEKKQFPLLDTAVPVQETETSYVSNQTTVSYLPEEEKEKKSIGKQLLTFALIVAAAFFISKVTTTYALWHTRVVGDSMNPALSNGDYLLVDKISYRYSVPERFDVVIFPYDDDTYYIKRIVGLPGEYVQIENGQIYINGVLLSEEFGTEEMDYGGIFEEGVLLGEEEYMVLGDNRNQSMDSRFEEVGTVKEYEITGKAWFCYYPWNHLGLIKGKDK